MEYKIRAKFYGSDEHCYYDEDNSMYNFWTPTSKTDVENITIFDNLAETYDTLFEKLVDDDFQKVWIEDDKDSVLVYDRGVVVEAKKELGLLS